MNRSYKSIVRFFDYAFINKEDSFDKIKIKKTIDFEFHNLIDKDLIINNFSYNKSELLDLVEQPDYHQQIAFHYYVWDNKYILQLLEQYTFRFEKITTEMQAINTINATYFSFYFSEVFNKVCKKLITEKKFYELGEYFKLLKYIQDTHKEHAFFELNIFINESIYYLENCFMSNYKDIRSHTLQWQIKGWSNWFNNLPDDFSHVKEKYLFNIMKLAVIASFYNHSDAVNINKELLCIATNAASSNAYFLSNISYLDPSSTRNSLIKIVKIIIRLIVILIVLFGLIFLLPNILNYLLLFVF